MAPYYTEATHPEGTRREHIVHLPEFECFTTDEPAKVSPRGYTHYHTEPEEPVRWDEESPQKIFIGYKPALIALCAKDEHEGNYEKHRWYGRKGGIDVLDYVVYYTAEVASKHTKQKRKGYYKKGRARAYYDPRAYALYGKVEHIVANLVCTQQMCARIL